MVGSQLTNKQTGNDPPIFRTIRLQQRDHSFRYSLCFPSVAIKALRRNVLQEDDILCELYADTRSDVSDYSDNESLDNDSDVPTISSHKQLRSSTGPLTPQFPDPFSSYQDNFYNSVRLAQTLLDRNMRVYSTRWASRGIPHDLEGEGKCLKKGKLVFQRNGDIMVQVWKDKTCANDKFDPLCNNCKQREERQENKHGNKEALCCWPVQ